MRTIPVLSLLGLLTTSGCAPEPCTVADNDDGTYTLTCPDGSSATIGNGTDGASWLVSTADEPEGANCPDGGQAVSVGPDADGDGELSASEVATTTYVCDGADGADGTSFLVDVQDEPPGDNCDNGGVEISVGPDDNGNGFLDEGEVASVEYVCDGLNGAPGEDATPTLVRTDDEPAGPNCDAGGIAVHTGKDTDENGALDDPEITSTTYVCDGAAGEDGADAGLAFPTSASTAYNTFSTGTVGSKSDGQYEAGSYVEDDLVGTGKTSITGLAFTFVLDDNTTTSCTVGTLDFDVIVNGTTVGEFSYVGGSGRDEIVISDSVAFSSVSGTGSGGDDYTLRFESAETVCSGGGSYAYYPGGRVTLLGD